MKRILTIDDEPNVRLNFRLALEVEGYQAVERHHAECQEPTANSTFLVRPRSP